MIFIIQIDTVKFRGFPLGFTSPGYKIGDAGFEVFAPVKYTTTVESLFFASEQVYMSTVYT